MLLYSKFPTLLSALAKHPSFNPPEPALTIEKNSILGPFFRLSSLQQDVTRTYFPDPRSLDKHRVHTSQDALRFTLRAHQDDLFSIANAFIRADAETKNRTLDWFGHIMNANHKRRALQVDPKEVSSDGFMMNLAVILDRFCEPFMDNTFSKVHRIEVEYFRRSPRVDVKDETKLNADQSKADAYYDQKTSGANNFISEVFFLTLAAHHYGSEATNSKLKNLERDIKFYEKHITAMEAERPKFANVSQIVFC
jgi:ubiquitin conjugation factor E4 B